MVKTKLSLAILDNLWAIAPDTLKKIESAAQGLMQGTLDGVKLAAQLADRNRARAFSRARDVAVIPLKGVLTRQLNLFSILFGGTSTAAAEGAFVAAMNSPEIRAILFLVDSPGGTVDGPVELADSVFRARGPKPIIAVADSMAASAAAWIATAADKFYLRTSTGVTGSIGVIATHYDFSRLEEARGLKVTEVTSAPGKSRTSSHAPLSDEGRDEMRRQVDFIHGEFISALARHRKVPIATAEAWGTGETFFADEAIRLGLADGFATPAALIDQLAGPEVASPAQAGPLTQLERLRLMASAYEAGRMAESLDRLHREQEARPQTMASEPIKANVGAETKKETPEQLAARCAEEWRRSPELRAEFSALERYVAYERAKATGRVWVFGGGTVMRIARPKDARP